MAFDLLLSLCLLALAQSFSPASTQVFNGKCGLVRSVPTSEAVSLFAKSKWDSLIDEDEDEELDFAVSFLYDDIIKYY